MSASIETVQAWARQAVAILRHRHPWARPETLQLWARIEEAATAEVLDVIVHDAIAAYEAMPKWQPGMEIGGDAIARAALSPKRPILGRRRKP